MSEQQKGAEAIRKYYDLPADATDEQADVASSKAGAEAIRKYYNLPADATDEQLREAEKAAAAARAKYEEMTGAKLP